MENQKNLIPETKYYIKYAWTLYPSLSARFSFLRSPYSWLSYASDLLPAVLSLT